MNKSTPLVFPVGPKKPEDRYVAKKLGRFIAVFALSTAALYGGKTLLDLNKGAGIQVETDAKIIGKMMYAGGPELAGSGVDKSNNVDWLPIKDSPKSAYQLLLSIPGELETQAIAVSKETFDSFCKRPKFDTLRDPDSNLTGHFCGGTVNDPDPEKRKSYVDDVRISFVKKGDTITITEFAGQEKEAPSFADALRLKRQPAQEKAPAPQKTNAL